MQPEVIKEKYEYTKLDKAVLPCDGKDRLYKTIIRDNGEFVRKAMAKGKADTNQQKMFSFLPK